MKRIIALLIITSIYISDIYAQEPFVLYNMRNVPASNSLLPVNNGNYKFYLILPFFPNMNMGLRAPYQFDELRTNKTTLSLDKLAEHYTDGADLGLNLNYSILGFGFKNGNAFFTFESTLKTEMSFMPNEEFFKVFTQGNLKNRNASVDIDLNAISYLENAIGYSKRINEKLHVGGKFKFLMGVGAAKTEKANMTLKTAEDNKYIEVGQETKLTTSAPIKITEDIDGKIDEVEFDGDNFSVGFDNSGWAFDLGATYDLTEKIKFSASIIDLGSIKWSKNLHTIEGKGTTKYEGGEIKADGSMDFEMDGFTDSISDIFEFEKTKEVTSFRSKLNRKIFVGANYAVHKKMDFGFLYGNIKRFDHIDNTYTLSFNARPWGFLSTSLSYTMLPGYSSYGAGLGLKFGPFMLTAASDYLAGLDLPKAQRMNLRFGLTIVVRDKKKKRESKSVIPVELEQNNPSETPVNDNNTQPTPQEKEEIDKSKKVDSDYEKFKKEFDKEFQKIEKDPKEDNKSDEKNKDDQKTNTNEKKTE